MHIKLTRKQQGLSMVELLVATAVGLLLLTGIIQIMTANKQVFSFQQSMTETQENSRFSLYFLQETISKTGYRRLPQDSRELAFPGEVATANCPAFRAGEIVRPSLQGTGVCIRYQALDPAAAPPEQDCSGNDITISDAISTRIFFDSVNNALVCGAQGGANSTLVDGVEDMQIVYGVDTSGNRSADKFIAAPANNEWDDVVSLRINLLTASSTTVNDTPQKYRFPLESASVTTAADKRLYKSSSKTFILYNVAL